MKFNVTYRNIVSELMPGTLRKTKFINVLYSLIKGLQDLNDTFYQKTQDIYYYLKFNAQVIYLEKYLNDNYDPVYNRINISGIDSGNVHYWFNKVEAETIFYVYNQWDISSSYAIGDYINYKNKIYHCIAINSGAQPDISTSSWSLDSDYVWFYNNIPIDGNYNFLVNVPYALSGFADKIKSSVNLFNLADKTFKINFI